MLLRTTILAIFFLSFLSKTYAQNLLPTVDSAYQHKWEISADVLWLFNRNTLPYSAMLRIHKGNATAFRLRIGGNYRENINPYKGRLITGSNDVNKREMQLFVSTGKEWQKRYNKFRLLYGNDIFVSYDLIDYIRPDTKFEGFIKDFNVGISPFVGAQYFVHRRISLSTEAHLNLAYKNYKVLRLPGGDINNPHESQNDKYIRADLLPFYVLNASYHF